MKTQTPIAKAIQKIREEKDKINPDEFASEEMKDVLEDVIYLLESLKEEEKQFKVGEHGNGELHRVMVEQFNKQYTQEDSICMFKNNACGNCPGDEKSQSICE